MSTPQALEKLRWQCRRGRLELDILFDRYIGQCYLMLSPQEKHLFTELLRCGDQDLYNWLIAANEEVPEEFVGIVAQIKEVAKDV